jgi:hypothetical protein
MKNTLTLLTIPALFFSVPMLASAASKPAPSETPSPAATPAPLPTPDKSHPFPFHGDVAAVDSTAKTFTVKSKAGGSERVFHVGENAKPAKEGWSGDFAAITVGAYATGTCTKTGAGKFEVATLHIGAKPVKKATPAPKASPTPKPAATPRPS